MSRPANSPVTLLDRIWASHRIEEREDGQTLLYVDRHYLQDGSAPSFEMLRQRGIKPRVPQRAFAVPDHYVPMSIEAGARAGMIAPDAKTFAYLEGKPSSPKGAAWDKALQRWKSLRSDDEACFDREVSLDADEIVPMLTWGTSPEDALPISGRVPDPSSAADASKRESMRRALEYMGLAPGTALDGVAVNRVFIGSCTNGRIEDLRAAAAVVRDRKVAKGVEAWVVPGSGLVKAQAESEGLDRVFLDAGFQWRYAGCSMCLGTNGDLVAPGERCASTSNRNFAGRQGPGARTHLMSPAMAAAAAVTGRLTDVRRLMGTIA